MALWEGVCEIVERTQFQVTLHHMLLGTITSSVCVLLNKSPKKLTIPASFVKIVLANKN